MKTIRMSIVATATLATLLMPLGSAAQGSEKAEPGIEIFANPMHVFVGQSFTLTWSSRNVTGCTASGDWSGPQALSGSQIITPDAEGRLTYSLVCSDSDSVRHVRDSAGVHVETPSLSLAGTFSPNSVTISTSEGALYGSCDFWLNEPSQCLKVSNFGFGPSKVFHVPICLSGEVSLVDCSKPGQVAGPLSDAMLAGIETRIAAFAGTGARLVVRFTYNFGPIGPGAMDAPIDVISTHIDQLAPILLRHRDLIAALDAGFIGTWGEWHDSTNGNETAGAQKTVLDKELANFKGVFPILVRNPGNLIQYTGNDVPPASLGLHDDAYASNVFDGGTWSPCHPGAGYCLSHSYTSDQFKAYAAKISTTTMFAGEFGVVDAALSPCSALDQYSYTYHPQWLSLSTAIVAFLKGEGCATSFYNKIGTRIELQNVNIIGDAKPGGKLYVAATMINAGYGRVIRRRPVRLVLLQNGEAVEKIKLRTAEIDLRTLVSSANPIPSTFQFEFTLPETLLPGPVTLALRFDDPAPSLSDQPAYALPLNSLDENGKSIFDAATGNNLIATLNID